MRNRKIQLVMLALGLAVLVGACSSAISQKPASKPLGSRQGNRLPDVWRSLTTGRKYFVRIDKSHFYAQWVNLPPVAARHSAYIHTVCKLEGSKWAGTSDIYLPCVVGEKKNEKIDNTCHLTLRIEIDSVSKDRITGRAQTLKKFDCSACNVIETGWKNFEWVPAS